MSIHVAMKHYYLWSWISQRTPFRGILPHIDLWDLQSKYYLCVAYSSYMLFPNMVLPSTTYADLRPWLIRIRPVTRPSNWLLDPYSLLLVFTVIHIRHVHWRSLVVSDQFFKPCKALYPHCLPNLSTCKSYKLCQSRANILILSRILIAYRS